MTGRNKWPPCQRLARLQIAIRAEMICLAKRAAEIGTHPPNWDELALTAARTAIAMETRQGGDVKQAPSQSDESAAIAQGLSND